MKLPNDDLSLAMLPTKFRKLIWIRCGDFLIVSGGTTDSTTITTSKGTKGAVTFLVEHILYKDQIKLLKQKNLWPKEFEEVNDTQEIVVAVKKIDLGSNDDVKPTSSEVIKATKPSVKLIGNTTVQIGQVEESDGEYYESEPDDDSALFVNRNRLGGHFADEEESEDEE